MSEGKGGGPLQEYPPYLLVRDALRLIIEAVIANGRGHLCEPERKQKQIGARYYTASILGLPEGPRVMTTISAPVSEQDK